MKPVLECLGCLIATRLREIENLEIDDHRKLVLSKEIVQEIAREFNYDVELTEFASRLFFNIIKKAPEIVEHYDIVKKKSNEIALMDLKMHINYLSKLDRLSRFKYLVKLATLANMIDYGVAGHSPLTKEITPSMVNESKVYIDDSERLYEYVSKGNRLILWLFDNAGEAIYDLLLIDELRRMNNKVVGLVKEYPGFQNDITIREAVDMDLQRALDGVFAYGCLCSTIHLDKVSGEIIDLLARSDLIIAKGMSHFEYLSEIELRKPVCFLLVPKCNPVAKKIGLGSRGSIVVSCRGL